MSVISTVAVSAATWSANSLSRPMWDYFVSHINQRVKKIAVKSQNEIDKAVKARSCMSTTTYKVFGAAFMIFGILATLTGFAASFGTGTLAAMIPLSYAIGLAVAGTILTVIGHIFLNYVKAVETAVMTWKAPIDLVHRIVGEPQAEPSSPNS